MTTYRVTFNRIGKNDKVGTVVMEDVENRDQLKNRIRKLVESEHVVMDPSTIEIQLFDDNSVWLGSKNGGLGTATVVESTDDGPLSVDRPCDWLIGGGKCGKPSANVRWDDRRWHCPEHAKEAKSAGWTPVPVGDKPRQCTWNKASGLRCKEPVAGVYRRQGMDREFCFHHGSQHEFVRSIDGSTAGPKPKVSTYNINGGVTITVDTGSLTKPASSPPPYLPLTPNDECTCGHPYWQHKDGKACTSSDGTDTCVQFLRRCESRYVGHWASRCDLAVGSHEVHQAEGGDRKWTDRYAYSWKAVS